MSASSSLKDLSQHLAFGANWADYARGVDEAHIAQARESLARLLGDGVRGRSFLDIGCGSGIHSLAALHRTGAMFEAIASAARMVAPRGLLCVALYRRTLLRRVWRAEKRPYTKRSARTQRILSGMSERAFRLGMRLAGRDPQRHEAEYRDRRGMSLDHDIQDWMGGHPCESIGPKALCRFVEPLGFRVVQQWVRPGGIGPFGSGCDEHLFRRP